LVRERILNKKAPVRLDTLDLLRAIAAFAVVAGHARAFTFESFTELREAAIDVGFVTKMFYLGTGLGHQAVIVFFALSGFLVGGKVLSDLFSHRFNWSIYVTRRLTRLWIVLIPALAATLLFDMAGVAMTNGSGYDGIYSQLYLSGPGPARPHDLSITAFLGNLVFVQTILVPTFGTNGAHFVFCARIRIHGTHRSFVLHTGVDPLARGNLGSRRDGFSTYTLWASEGMACIIIGSAGVSSRAFCRSCREQDNTF
jgi:hypothetical protein